MAELVGQEQQARFAENMRRLKADLQSKGLDIETLSEAVSKLEPRKDEPDARLSLLKILTEKINEAHKTIRRMSLSLATEPPKLDNNAAQSLERGYESLAKRIERALTKLPVSESPKETDKGYSDIFFN